MGVLKYNFDIWILPNYSDTSHTRSGYVSIYISFSLSFSVSLSFPFSFISLSHTFQYSLAVKQKKSCWEHGIYIRWLLRYSYACMRQSIPFGLSKVFHYIKSTMVGSLKERAGVRAKLGGDPEWQVNLWMDPNHTKI